MKYFGEFRFDQQHGLLWQSGLRVPLTAKAAAVLGSLMEAPEQRLTLNEILRRVWPDTHVTSGNIKVLVREIRQALGDEAQAPRFVRTVPHGYELIPRASDTPPRLAQHAAPVFVGRSSELNAIETVYAAAGTGVRGFVVVTGGPGLGKTALLEQAVHRAARQGFAILQAACQRTAGTPEPLSPLLDAVHKALADMPHVRDVIAPHAPALLQYLTDPARPRTTGRDSTSVMPRLVREMGAAIEALAKESPVLLALDDVQWLDQASAQAIDALARRPYDCRLALLVTSRPFSGSTSAHPVARLAADLMLADSCTALHLAPLTEAEVQEYSSRRFGFRVAAEVAHLLFSASEGHPALFAASANALVRDGVIAPSGDGWSVVGGTTDLAITVVNALEQAMERRLGELTAEERRLLGLVSTLGLEFSAGKAARISEQDQVTVERMLDRLARQADIITRREIRGHDGAIYQFTNAVYLELLNGPDSLNGVRGNEDAVQPRNY